MVLSVGAELVAMALDIRRRAFRGAGALWRVLLAAVAVAKMWLVLRSSHT